MPKIPQSRALKARSIKETVSRVAYRNNYRLLGNYYGTVMLLGNYYGTVKQLGTGCWVIITVP